MIAQSKSTNISLAELVDQANGLDWGGPTPTSEPLITQFLTQSHSALDGDLLARISPSQLPPSPITRRISENHASPCKDFGEFYQSLQEFAGILAESLLGSLLEFAGNWLANIR